MGDKVELETFKQRVFDVSALLVSKGFVPYVEDFDYYASGMTLGFRGSDNVYVLIYTFYEDYDGWTILVSRAGMPEKGDDLGYFLNPHMREVTKIMSFLGVDFDQQLSDQNTVKALFIEHFDEIVEVARDETKIADIMPMRLVGNEGL